MIYLRRKDDTLVAKLARLSEFYTNSELDDFAGSIKYQNFEDAIRFLDMQTRADYWITGGENPNIYAYAVMYNKWKKEHV